MHFNLLKLVELRKSCTTPNDLMDSLAELANFIRSRLAYQELVPAAHLPTKDHPWAGRVVLPTLLHELRNVLHQQTRLVLAVLCAEPTSNAALASLRMMIVVPRTLIELTGPAQGFNQRPKHGLEWTVLP